MSEVVVQNNKMVTIWPVLLNYSRHDCLKILRRLELEAYGKVVAVLRAQGPLTEEKRKLLNKLQLFLSVSVERHKAEVRRALNDEELATISEAICGKEVDEEWILEGKRISPIFHRPSPETIYLPQANKASLQQLIENCGFINSSQNPSTSQAKDTSTNHSTDERCYTYDSTVSVSTNKTVGHDVENDSHGDPPNHDLTDFQVDSTSATHTLSQSYTNSSVSEPKSGNLRSSESEINSTAIGSNSLSKGNISETTTAGSTKLCDSSASIISQVIEDHSGATLVPSSKSVVPETNVDDHQPRSEPINQHIAPPTQLLLNHQSGDSQSLVTVSYSDFGNSCELQQTLTPASRIPTVKPINQPSSKLVSAATVHVLTSNAVTAQCASPLVVQMHKTIEDPNMQRISITNPINSVFVPDKSNATKRINNYSVNSHSNHSMLHMNKLNQSRTIAAIRPTTTKDHIVNMTRPNTVSMPHNINSVQSIQPPMQHRVQQHSGYTNSVVLPSNTLPKISAVVAPMTTPSAVTTLTSNTQQILKTVAPMTTSSVHSASSLVVGSIVNIRSDGSSGNVAVTDQSNRIQWSSSANANPVCLNTFTTTNITASPVSLNTTNNSSNNVILFHKGVARKMFTATNPPTIRLGCNLSVTNQAGPARQLPVITNNNLANRQIRILGLANTRQPPNLIQSSAPASPHVNQISDLGFISNAATMDANIVVANTNSSRINIPHSQSLVNVLPTIRSSSTINVPATASPNSRLGAILEVDLDAEGYSENTRQQSPYLTPNVHPGSHERLVTTTPTTTTTTTTTNTNTTTSTTTNINNNKLIDNRENMTVVIKSQTHGLSNVQYPTMTVESIRPTTNCEQVKNLGTNDFNTTSTNTVRQKRAYQDSSELESIKVSADSQLIQDCDRDTQSQNSTHTLIIAATKPALDNQFQPPQPKRLCAESDTSSANRTPQSEADYLPALVTTQSSIQVTSSIPSLSRINQ